MSEANSNMPQNGTGSHSSHDWEIIVVVYTHVLIPLLRAVIVGAIVVSHSGLSPNTTRSGHILFIVSIILCVVFMCLLLGCRSLCPLNCVLHLLWSVSFGFALGLSCAFPDGKGNTVFAAIILTTSFVGCLVLYSILGYIRKNEYGLGGFCIFFILLIVCIYVPIQIFHPFAKPWTAIWGIFAAISFCGHTLFAANLIVDGFDRNRNLEDDPFGPMYAATVLAFVILLASKPPRGSGGRNVVLTYDDLLHR